jgi:hypothetical protein
MRDKPDRLRHPEKTERQTLEQWALQLLAGDPRPWPLQENPDGRESARAFFRSEGIGPLCHYTLQSAAAESAVPRAVWDLLREERQAAVALDLMRGKQDGRVLQWLADIGLRPLVLKGAAYAAGLYPEAHLRPRCDTDLLFPDQESARQAWQRLEAEGYAPMPNVVEGRLVSRQRTYVKATGGRHALDLHWAISNTHSFVRALPYHELNRDAVVLPRLHVQARTLSPVHSLLFACLHLFGHERFEHLPKLLWLYDIDLLSRQLSEPDWSTFSRVAITKEVAGICRHVLDEANDRFPVEAYGTIRPALAVAERMESFRPDRLKSSLHFLYYDMKALDGWADRLQWLRESLFPSAEYMRSKYPQSNHLWLPLLYVRRAATGLAKQFKH